jgi:hypothetical protein
MFYKILVTHSSYRYASDEWLVTDGVYLSWKVCSSLLNCQGKRHRDDVKGGGGGGDWKEIFVQVRSFPFLMRHSSAESLWWLNTKRITMAAFPEAIPVAENSKARGCGLSLIETTGSNPTGASIPCFLWVSSVVRSLCDWQFFPPEESFRQRYVIVCNLQISRKRRSWLAWGYFAWGEKILDETIILLLMFWYSPYNDYEELLSF